MIKQLLSLLVTFPLIAGMSYAQNNPFTSGQTQSTVNFKSIGLKAQHADNGSHNHAPGERCLQHAKTEEFKASNPDLQTAFDDARETNLRIMAELESGERSAPPVYTIPVVFHVIHKGEDPGVVTNISSAQIESAVEALNRDFRRTNEDGGIALGNGPDTEIQFCLAGVDPNGNPHSGINRVNGTGVSGYSSSGITNSNESAVKNLSKWDNRYYLNVWVVSEINDNGADVSNVNNFFGGTIGYAYLPINNVQNNPDDGIVILNLSVGNDPNGSQNFRLWGAGETNRALTHEVGHFLGLNHVFSDFNPNSCSDGDGISDTPSAQQVSMFNCNYNGSCSGQQIENYMDYTPEQCQNQFTSGQTSVMRATLTGSRNDLVNTSNCGVSTNYDAGISAILSPNGALCNTNFTPVVTLNNYGATTLTSVNIQYFIDGNAPTTYNWSGNLASNSSAQVTLDPLTTTAGAHTFTARTASNSLNGSNTDQELSNDQSTSSFNVGSGGTEVNIVIELDCWGDETEWEITNSGGAVVASGGPYAQSLPDGAGTESASACLAEGCYDFTITDSGNDGLYGSQFGSCNVDGSYQITDGNGSILAQMIANQGDFGSSETQNFCIGTPTTSTCEDLFTFDGENFAINETDQATFEAIAYEADGEEVNAGLAAQGVTGSWQFDITEDTPTENWSAYVTSYHADETAPANNWLNIGPLTMPAGGGEIRWKHRYFDNNFRDGYQVLVGTAGIEPLDFAISTQIYSVTDNDASTDGDLDWTEQVVELDAGTYGGQQLYFAVHHTALNMYFLAIDDIVVEGCSSSPVGIAEIESINLTVYPNPSSENFVVQYQNVAGDDLNFSMFNAVGQEVWSNSTSTKGASTETINTSNLNSGIYTLIVRGTNLNESKRLVLTK